VVVAPSAELNRRVVAGSLDCAVIEGEPDPALVAVQLAQDELVFVAHRDHPLSRLHRVTAADLANHRYMRRGPEFSAESLVRDVLGETYDRLETLNLGHPEYVRAATVAGLGFSALSRLAVEHDLSTKVLKRLPLPSVMRAISAVRRTSRGGPAQEAFWELLTGALAGSSARISADGQRS
jgi:DNA-binding transcriptional LysR family regulator